MIRCWLTRESNLIWLTGLDISCKDLIFTTGSATFCVNSGSKRCYKFAAGSVLQVKQRIRGRNTQNMSTVTFWIRFKAPLLVPPCLARQHLLIGGRQTRRTWANLISTEPTIWRKWLQTFGCGHHDLNSYPISQTLLNKIPRWRRRAGWTVPHQVVPTHLSR